MRQGQVDESGEKGTLCDSEANILPFQPMEHNEGCSERQVCRTKCLSPPPPNKQKSSKRSHISYLMMHLKSLEKEEISEKRRREETND